MSKLSDMAAAIQTRIGEAKDKRDADFDAKFDAFKVQYDAHNSAISTNMASIAAGKEARDASFSEAYSAAKDAMDAKIADLESNVDPEALDSIGEGAAAIAAADTLMENSILSYKTDEAALQAAMEASIGSSADVDLVFA